jgi:hypothetical protein
VKIELVASLFLMCSSMLFSEEIDLDLASDDFDLLEDSSFEELEADLGISNELQIFTENEASESNISKGPSRLGGSDTFSGSIIQSIVFGIENPGSFFNRNSRGLERIRTNINLSTKGEVSSNLKYKFGGLVRFDWGDWQEEKFRFGGNSPELKFKDVFLDFYPSNNIWIRIGNQIIARGQFDTLSISDTINPRDLSIPAQGELSEFRQHIPAILVNFPLSDFKIEVVVTHNAGANNLGEIGSGFDPMALFQSLMVPGGSPLVPVYLKPSNQTELFARLNYSFNGGDFAVVVSDENLNQRNLKGITATTPSTELSFGFDRVRMFGLSGNVARGNYLFKYEGAHFSNMPIAGKDPTSLPWNKRDQSILGLGIDYSGVDNLTLGFETDIKLTKDYTNDLSGSETSVGQSIQARWTGLNDLLTINGTLSRLNGEKSFISSIAANYKVRDGLSLGGRLVQYQASSVADSFYPYKNQDVIMLSTEYSF